MTATLARDNCAAAWGAAAPDWVLAMAEACDRTSQAQVARQIGYSAAVVNTVLKRSYGGDLRRVESAVRGAFQQTVVACPVLGEISSTACIGLQRRPLKPTNPQRVQLYRACRDGCPNFRRSGASHDR